MRSVAARTPHVRDVIVRLAKMEVARKVHYDACDMQNGELTWSCGGAGDAGDNSPECDVLDSSVDDFDSPPPLQPRKLFDATDCNDDEGQPMNNNNKIPIFVTG